MSVMNIPLNAILPVDPRKMMVLLGTAEYVALEVLVSKLARYFLKSPKGWTELIFIHTLSMPFMGGLVGMTADVNDIDEIPVSYKNLFMDGAKGIPAVLVAQWILDTFAKGFHFPWFNMRDLLITAGAKILTRPLTGFIIDYLPKDAHDAFRVINEMIKRQQAVSNFHS